MSYVWLVLIIATLNLALGFSLPWIMENVFAVDILPIRNSTVQTSSSADGITVSASETAAPKSTQLEPYDATGAEVPPSNAEIKILTWDGVAQQVLAFGDPHTRRLLMLEAQLGKEDEASGVFEQRVRETEEILTAWSDELEANVEPLLEALINVPGGADVSIRFEGVLFDLLAQLETSQSNLKGLEATSDTASTEQLSKELTTAQQSFATFNTNFTELIELVHQFHAVM